MAVRTSSPDHVVTQPPACETRMCPSVPTLLRNSNTAHRRRPDRCRERQRGPLSAGGWVAAQPEVPAAEERAGRRARRALRYAGRPWGRCPRVLLSRCASTGSRRPANLCLDRCEWSSALSSRQQGSLCSPVRHVPGNARRIVANELATWGSSTRRVPTDRPYPRHAWYCQVRPTEPIPVRTRRHRRHSHGGKPSFARASLSSAFCLSKSACSRSSRARSRKPPSTSGSRPMDRCRGLSLMGGNRIGSCVR